MVKLLPGGLLSQPGLWLASLESRPFSKFSFPSVLLAMALCGQVLKSSPALPLLSLRFPGSCIQPGARGSHGDTQRTALHSLPRRVLWGPADCCMTHRPPLLLHPHPTTSLPHPCLRSYLALGHSWASHPPVFRTEPNLALPPLPQAVSRFSPCPGSEVPFI